MLPPVNSILLAAVPVTAITSRIYRHDHAPQNAVRPYVTWFLLNGEPGNTLSELPGYDRTTIQVDCWHETDAGVVDLATAVRDAIEPYAHCTAVPINGRERETKLFRIGLQFDWFVNR